MALPGFVRRYRRVLSFALMLVVIEKVAWIIEPTVFGNVIDAMIEASAGPPKGWPLVPLFIWVGVFVVNSGVGTFRRSRDQRIYLDIYADLAENIAMSARKEGESSAKAASRAELSREYISFFQNRIPEIIEQGIDIVGATIALAFFDWRLSVACFSILIPLYFIRQISTRKISEYQKHLHDKRENVYEVFAGANREEIRRYYGDISVWQRKISNWGAFNFGLIRTFLLGIFVVILYIAIDLDDFSTGNIYAIAAYVWTFVTSSEYLPEQMEGWTSLKDISRRVTFEGPDVV